MYVSRDFSRSVLGEMASPSVSKKRIFLTLEDRVKVINRSDLGETGISIAKSLGVGKTQIQSIIKEKEKILQRWESGESAGKLAKKRRTMYDNLNEKVWEWYIDVRKRNAPVSSKLIREKAFMLSKELGHDDFSASNGWLEKWRKRNNVKPSALSGEYVKNENAGETTGGPENTATLLLYENRHCSQTQDPTITPTIIPPSIIPSVTPTIPPTFTPTIPPGVSPTQDTFVITPISIKVEPEEEDGNDDDDGNEDDASCSNGGEAQDASGASGRCGARHDRCSDQWVCGSPQQCRGWQSPPGEVDTALAWQAEVAQRKRGDGDPLMCVLQEVVEHLREKQCGREVDSENQRYCHHLAPQLDRLNFVNLLKVKKKINDVVYQALIQQEEDNGS